jgi:uncharacterized protein YsxB (DUF464 family)
MIKAQIYRTKSGKIYGFKVTDHGDPIVCSAVSALALNAVNSIEALTDADFSVDASEDGGDLELVVTTLRDGGKADEAELLLNSLVLGLGQIELDYNDDLKLFD